MIRPSALLPYLLIAMSPLAAQDPPMPAPETTADPHLWLEDVAGEKALDWVRARNEKAKEVLTRSLLNPPVTAPVHPQGD